jgi:hypothetical protein
MKSKFIRAAASLLSGILLFSCALTRTAGAAEVELNGVNSAPQWAAMVADTYGPGGAEITDLFGAATKNLAPGDEKTFSVQLRNSSPDPVVFYLKATAFTPSQADALADGAYFPDAVFDAARHDALLAAIKLEITHGGATLYKGTLGGTAEAGSNAMYSGTYGVALGQVSAGYVGNINVKLTVGDLGNDFQRLLTGVEWVFIANQLTPGAQPLPTATPTPVSVDTPPPDATDGVDITDGDTPLTDLDDGKLTDIDGGDVPLDALPDIIVVPKTGDGGGGLLTYGTVAGLALASMTALLIVGSRKRKKS